MAGLKYSHMKNTLFLYIYICVSLVLMVRTAALFADDYNEFMVNRDLGVKGQREIVLNGGYVPFKSNGKEDRTGLRSHEDDFRDLVAEFNRDKNGKIVRISEYGLLSNDGLVRASTSQFKNGSITSLTVCVGKPSEGAPCVTISKERCRLLDLTVPLASKPKDLGDMKKAMDCAGRLGAILDLSSLTDPKLAASDTKELTGFIARHPPRFSMATRAAAQGMAFHSSSPKKASTMDLETQVQIADKVIQMCKRMKEPISPGWVKDPEAIQ